MKKFVVPTIVTINLMIVAALVLSSCGKIERGTAALKGYSTMCVDGVEYIQFTSGATVKYNRDGKISTC